MKRFMPLYKYSVGEGKSGKGNRFYVWNTEKKCVHKGNLTKFDAVGLEHRLNNRKFLEIK